MIDPLRSEDATESRLSSSSRLRRSLFLFFFHRNGRAESGFLVII